MKPKQKNRIILLIVLAMSIIPFGIAWYLAANPHFVITGTNKGHLIDPPIPTTFAEFNPFDVFSDTNMHELRGRWVLINFIEDKQCDQQCLAAQHKSKQIRLMMSKDLTRIRRVVLVLNEIDQKTAADWWQQDIRLLRATPQQSLLKKITQIAFQRPLSGTLMIMDPLGNLMMHYSSGFNPYDVKKDLTKLLRISQIG